VHTKKESKHAEDGTGIILRLKRRLFEIDGREFPVHIGEYEFDLKEEVSCVNIDDDIPAGVLTAGKHYVFQAALVDERGNEVKDTPRVNLEFDVVAR
jgi:hypothetical protein